MSKTMTTSIQSVITPAATNGLDHDVDAIVIAATPKAKAPKAKIIKSEALMASTESEALMASTAMTPAEAVQIAFDYGVTMAGQDGTLTNAFKAFANNVKVIADMVQALNVGYVMRKMGYTKEKATKTVNKTKHNPEAKTQNNDTHRTFDEQRVMNTVRVLVHRAKTMAGLVVKTETAITAEATRAANEAEAKAREARLIKADELVNPKDNVDAFDALSRLVLTMKSLQNKYADKLTGDRGMAWRDWLANAPK